LFDNDLRGLGGWARPSTSRTCWRLPPRAGSRCAMATGRVARMVELLHAKVAQCTVRCAFFLFQGCPRFGHQQGVLV
jgi:hypothetical protein